MKRKRMLVIGALCVLGLVVGPAVGGAGASAEPWPYTTQVDVPNSVTVGHSFTIDVKARNYGEAAGKYSTISVSSPTLDEYDDGKQARVVSDTFNYTTVKSAGDDIWNRDGEKIDAKYLLVEGGTTADGAWKDEHDRSLSVEFTPEETGTFVIYVRTTMADQGSTSTVTDPYSSQYTGQQGYHVERYTVHVRPKSDIDAGLSHVSVGSGDFERGDTVDGAATVTNTGNREHTFFVGYSVYDGVGKAHNGATPGAVTLAPGESRRVDLDWTVPDTARAGSYDARVSVWKEADPDNLHTRLADNQQTGTFRVREEPDIDAAIETATVDDGTFRYGESVDASVKVSNTGNREHTFFVGYSVSDGDGHTYDNGGQTGKTVTLGPGDSQWVDVSWTVQDGVSAGQYDARVSVWKESDRNGLYTRLADEQQTDQFAVRPLATVGFTVSKKSSIEGYEFSGDPIPEATVHIAGRELTTDDEGKVSVELPVNSYDYTVSASGYSGVSGTVQMHAGTYHAVSAPLVREGVGVVEVNVVDSDSDPVGGNTYRLLVDGSEVEPTAQGELLLEAGTHTLAVEPTEFGRSQNLKRTEQVVTVDAGTRTTATVRPVADVGATITDFTADTGEHTQGSSVSGSVTVQNTGEAEHTFFVGYSAVGPDGTAYDNDDSTGTAVTLASGETRTVDVLWDSSDAPIATYDLVATVWEESDRDNLRTDLDSARKSDAVELGLGGGLTDEERQTIASYARSDADVNVFEPVSYDGNVYLIAYATPSESQAPGVDYVGDAHSPRRVFADADVWSFYDVRRTFVFERTASGLEFVPGERSDVIRNVTRTQAALYWTHSGITRTAFPRYERLHDQMLHSPRADINFWFENAVGSALKSEEDRYLAALQTMTTASTDYKLIPEEAATQIKQAKSATGSANTALGIAQEYEAQKWVKVAGKRVDSDLVQDALNRYADKIKRIDTDRIGYGTSLVSLVLSISEQQTYKDRQVAMLTDVQQYAHTTPGVSLPDGLDDAISELETQHENSDAKTVEAIEQWAKSDGVEFAKLGAKTVGTKFGSWLVTKSSYAASVSTWASSSTAGTLAASSASLASSGLLGWQIGGMLTGRGATYAALMEADYALKTSEHLQSVRANVRDRYGENLSQDGLPQADVARVFHAATYTKRVALVEFHRQDAAALDESILGEYEAFIENVFGQEAYAREKKADLLDQARREQTFAAQVNESTAAEVLGQYASRTDARLTSVGQQTGTYAPGETVSATVTVENTGLADHTFYVGYSAVGPNGTAYDDGDTTGKAVAIPAGESQTVTVEWTVQQSGPPGRYDTVVSVWAESDPGELTTRLDTVRRYDAIAVERSAGGLSALSVTVTDVTNCGPTCRYLSYAIENPTNETVESVRANLALSSGGQVVWTGNQSFGDVAPGRLVRTARVELTEDNAKVVYENDYRVTLDLTVISADDRRTVTLDGKLD